jgi:tRNA U34 5-methylaminomethyl-2-thiouridine-forming methyltransferase MnmC
LDEVEKLNYVSELKATDLKALFQTLHTNPWEEKHQITSEFSLLKRKQFFTDIEDENQFDVIYFDAFGARVQPELWTEEIFAKMFTALKSGGTLVTYSAKGSVRRAMQSVGFTVERLPGPPGKREMLRATKKLQV